MSTKGIGRQIQVAIAKEAVRGTANTLTGLYWLAFAEHNIDEKYMNATDEQSYGRIEDSTGETRAKVWAEGAIKAPIGSSSVGLIMLSMFGNDTVATHSGETVVYDHGFNVEQTTIHQSVTVSIHDPLAVKDYSHANAVFHKLSISYALDQFIDISVDVKAQAGFNFTPVLTPAQNALETRFLPQHFTFKTASAVSGLAAASAIGIKNLKLDINENVEEDAVLGSLAPRDFLNKSFSIEGQLEAIWNGESDFKTNAIANTATALRLDLVNTDVTIGSASHPRLVFDLYKCIFTEFSKPIKVKDLIYQTVKFKAHYSITDGRMVAATLTNLVSAY